MYSVGRSGEATWGTLTGGSSTIDGTGGNCGTAGGGAVAAPDAAGPLITTVPRSRVGSTGSVLGLPSRVGSFGSVLGFCSCHTSVESALGLAAGGCRGLLSVGLGEAVGRASAAGGCVPAANRLSIISRQLA